MSEKNNTTLITAAPPEEPHAPYLLRNLDDVLRLGHTLASSGMFSTARTPAAAAAKILTGLELGFGPMASMSDIHYFDGHPTVGAHLRAAAIKKSVKYDFDLKENENPRQSCTLVFWERTSAQGGEPRKNLLGWVRRGEISMTYQEAVETGVACCSEGKGVYRDGVWLKNNWARSPDDMLFARCISKGYRRYCPDLTGGVLAYDPDELDADTAPAPASTPPVLSDRPAEVQDADFTVTPAPEVPLPNPAPPQEAGELTEAEYEDLARTAREYHRSVAGVKAVCGALGVPVLRKTPRAKLSWATTALTLGLAPTPTVDRVAVLVEELKLDWVKFRDRLQEKYQVTSLAHLFPHQIEEVEKGLLELKARRQQQPAA
jgi:hypothetical protein